jgi:hypothetical protein
MGDVPRLAVLLGLCACAHARKVDALVDAGWLGEACVAAVDLDEPPQSLLDAHLRSTPRLVAEVVPADAFPAAPAYGRAVLVAHLLVDESGSPAPQRSVAVAFTDHERGWAGCGPSCSDAWVRDALGYPPLRESTPGDGIRALLGFVATAGAMMADAMLLPARAIQALGDADQTIPWLTPRALQYLGGELPSGGPVTIPASRLEALHPSVDGVCLADGPCADTWIGQPAETGLPPDTMAVTWTWRHDGCAVWATWTAPLGPGDTAGERLNSTFATPFVPSGRPVRWGVDAR